MSSLDNGIETCFRYRFANKPAVQKNDLLSVLSECGDDNYVHRYPYSILWKITTACNLRCKHCLYRFTPGGYEPKDNYTAEELLELARFFIDKLNLVSFSISGGEPFMQKGIFPLLAYLSSKNVYIDIKTNATLITKEIARKLSELLNREQTVIQVSLEGGSREINDRIRGKGCFEKAIAGIRNLSALGFRIRVSCTVTTENVDDLGLLYEVCRELQVSELLLGKLKVSDEKQAYLEPALDKVFCSIAQVVERAVHEGTPAVNAGALTVCDFLHYEIGRRLMDEYIKTKPEKTFVNLSCHKHNRFVLNADGRVYLCTDTEEEELCLGNLREKDFNTLWDHRFENVFFQKRDRCACTQCRYVAVCHGGCPARAYKVYGEVNAPDGSCSYAKKMNYR